MRRFPLLLVLAALLATQACSSDNTGDEEEADEDPITEGTWFRPAVDDSWYMQLEGPVLSEDFVDVVVIDLFNATADEIDRLQAGGRKVLCRFSAGRYDPLAEDAPSFDAQDLGGEIAGTNKHRWLNIRSPRVRTPIAARVRTARDLGCNGVVPADADNYLVDTGFTVLASHQLTYSRWLYNEAHRNRLAVGLANNGGQVAALIDYVDFALVERCRERGECDRFAPFVAASKPVFSAEYKAEYASDAGARQAMCTAARAANFRTIVLSPALDGSVRFSCDG